VASATRWPADAGSWPVDRAERYRQEGYWTGETLAELLSEPARADGSRLALITKDQRVSYASLHERADRLAAGLAAAGLTAGDRLVVQLPNSAELVATCVALFRLGAIPVLALAAHRRAEIGYLCRHTEATGLVIPDLHLGFDHRELAAELVAEHRELAHVLVAGDPGEFTALADVSAEPVELPAPDPAQIALCLLSGGTTGQPKLIPRTHQDYLCQIRGTAKEMGLDARGSYLAALPIAHNAALGCPGVLGALRAGARVLLPDSPAPDEVFPLIGREGATLTTVMPAFLPLWSAMADLFDVDLSCLIVEVGGARLDPEVARSAEQALGCTLTRWFGMAEGLLCFTRPADPAPVRYETEGRSLYPADEIRVVGEDGEDVAPGSTGELIARGPYTFTGYYRAADYNAQVFTSDGYFRTGDLVHLTADGNLVVDGRIKDVINRGGEKVPATELEDCLRTHGKVKDVAVTAVPDAGLGERTCAFVIPVDEPPSLAELREFLTGQGLAGYKLPDQLELVSAFPYTPVGKVDKSALSAGLMAP
jgi:2,3-dihydroxybenzoate-AMP ligase